MDRGFNSYSIKSHNLSIKDLDLNKREVAVYLSKFDTIDSDGDMIVRGAFSRSLKERGVGSDSNRQIAFLRHHDWQQQIGKFNRLEEDSEGLFAVGQLGTSTKGEDALRDYDEGIITEHSIGFQYIMDKTKYIEDENVKGGGYYVLNEVKLWEGSAVTFGANEYTNVVEVAKSEGRQNIVQKLSKEIDTITKAIINGRGTNERQYDLEMKLKFLNARLVDLAQSPITPNVKEETRIDTGQSFDWNTLGTLIN
jgi:HK97 family phage prohead protease